jgi:hypothetical protein
MKKRSWLQRNGIAAVLLVVASGAWGLVACSDDDGSDACEANLLPGDLVITEVMPNPEGADEGKEWFEVYNATSATIDLRGVTLVYSRADGTSRKTHVIESASIDAGEYMVFGGIIEVAMPAYMDYAYAGDLGSLTNTGGRLAIECNSTLVDDIVYLDGASGVSLSYDGRLVPDAIGNDTITDWCDSESEFEVDGLGTPGAANDYCEGVNPTGTCLDGGVERDIVPPQAGDAVITELMPNPDAASDADGEWFEVYFAQAADLNGLELGKDPSSIDFTVGDANCLPVAAGTYVLFAVEGNTALNGGLPPVDMVFDGFTLANAGGGIFVGYDGAVLDQITYTGGMVSAGASTSLDSAVLSATENDDATNWCDGVDAFGAGDLGTPGAANPSCGFVPPDTCIDPVTSNSRDLVPPVAGDVIITEFMANPDAVSDTQGEWFEVYFAQDADLNGLQLGDTGNPAAATVTSADCIPVTAGTYVVFARNADSATNGGLTDVALAFSFTLSNSAADSISVGYNSAVFDEITFSTSSVGASTSLSATALDPTLNDNPGNWCDAVASYGDGDLGTPGTANPTCP